LGISRRRNREFFQRELSKYNRHSSNKKIKVATNNLKEYSKFQDNGNRRVNMLIKAIN